MILNEVNNIHICSLPSCNSRCHSNKFGTRASENRDTITLYFAVCRLRIDLNVVVRFTKSKNTPKYLLAYSFRKYQHAWLLRCETRWPDYLFNS